MNNLDDQANYLIEQKEEKKKNDGLVQVNFDKSFVSSQEKRLKFNLIL